MKKFSKILSSVAATSFLIAGTSAFAVDPGACGACHGADGISVSDTIPNLKGQKKGYIVNQLKAFKSGDRKNGIMNGQAAGLSDDDMASLADHYNSL